MQFEVNMKKHIFRSSTFYDYNMFLLMITKSCVYRRGKKRKAAWKDEADEDVLVKDVAANYKLVYYSTTTILLHYIQGRIQGAYSLKLASP